MCIRDRGKSADSAEIHQDDQNKLRKNTELRCDSKGKPDRSDGGRRFIKLSLIHICNSYCKVIYSTMAASVSLE